MGSVCGITAWGLAKRYFDGSILDESINLSFSKISAGSVQLDWNSVRGAYYKLQTGSHPDAAFLSDYTDWIWTLETTESLLFPEAEALQAPAYFRVLRSLEAPEE
jgi:hypothetical protein